METLVYGYHGNVLFGDHLCVVYRVTMGQGTCTLFIVALVSHGTGR